MGKSIKGKTQLSTVLKFFFIFKIKINIYWLKWIHTIQNIK